MEVDEVGVESRMVRRDGVTIELLGFVSPGATGDGGRRPMNQLGLTHLSLRVDDVDQVAAGHRGLRGHGCAPTHGPHSICPEPGSTSSTAPIPTASASS